MPTLGNAETSLEFLRGRLGGIVRLEVMGLVKLVAAIWPLAGFTVIVAILVVFYCQVRKILEQHGDQMKEFGATFEEAFKVIKKQLVRERKIIL